nr:hypothetical protein [Tanacetum cinerariifolium]
TKGSQSRQLSASKSASAEEPVQTTCQIAETPHPVFDTGADDKPIIQTSQHPEWFSQPRKPPSLDRAWNTALPAAQGDAQSWISDLARQTDARSSFNELLDTPIDFSNFIMHRLNDSKMFGADCWLRDSEKQQQKSRTISCDSWHQLDHPLFEKPFLDKRLNELTMMVLMRQTESCDMLVHMVMTDMKLRVVETEIADITADDVDTVFCSTNIGRSKQLDQKFGHSSIEPHLHDLHVDRDKHEVDRR